MITIHTETVGQCFATVGVVQIGPAQGPRETVHVTGLAGYGFTGAVESEAWHWARKHLYVGSTTQASAVAAGHALAEEAAA